MPPSSSSTSGPYSLPDKDEMQLSAEDDWTRVKDRKEKKRIQNRVAQRSYRSRMKARLGELQSRLQYHEDQRAREDSDHRNLSPMSPPSPSNNDSLIKAPSSSINASKPQEIEPSSAATPSSTPPDVSSETDANQQRVKTMGNFPHQQIDVASADSSPWFIDSSSLLPHGDTSYAQPSIPTPPVTIPHPPSPMISAFVPQCQRGADEGTSSLSQSILQDCLRFQMQLLTKINAPDNASATQRDELLSTMQNTIFSNASHIIGADSYSDLSATEFPTGGNMLELTAGQAVPTIPWKPMIQSYDGPRLSTSSEVGDMVNTKTSPTPNAILGSREGVNSDLFAKSASHSPFDPTTQPLESLDERIEVALEGLESLGFSNFDSFAEAYYNGNFDHSSHLSAEQGVSRKRRLPRLLSRILDAAQTWDPWERRSLNEEVLRAAETLLVMEGKGIDEKSLEASIHNLGGLYSVADGGQTHQKSPDLWQNVSTVRKMFQNELPNLWPLMMALAGGTKATRQRDRSNMVLGSILILNCYGKMPKQKLLKLLDACM